MFSIKHCTEAHVQWNITFVTSCDAHIFEVMVKAEYKCGALYFISFVNNLFIKKHQDFLSLIYSGT